MISIRLNGTLLAACLVLGAAGCGSDYTPVNSNATSAATADQPQRALTFAANRSLGSVLARPAGSDDKVAWSVLGEAMGEVSVPATYDVKLEINALGANDLSPLAGVAPGSVQEISFGGGAFPEDQLQHLAHLTDLVGLNLNNTKISDAGVDRIAGLKSLRKLGLGDTLITDAGLQKLSGLTNLERLWLSNTPITDAGLEHLQSIPSLRRLILYGTQITDAGLGHLTKLPNLERLGLEGTKVTDAGIMTLADAPALREVSVGSTAVTPAGQDAVVSKAPNLQFLKSPGQ